MTGGPPAPGVIGAEPPPILPRSSAPREDRTIGPADEPAHALDERALVERARTDADAFAELYRRHLDGIHAFVARRLGPASAAVDDVTSATFERALTKLHRFRWRSAGIRPWLFRLAANEISEHHRSQSRHRTDRAQATLGRWYQPAVDAPGGDDPAHDERDRLRSAIDQLGPRHQQAIGLRYFADLDNDEAARAMGMPPGTFAVTVHRARRALQRILEEDQR